MSIKCPVIDFPSTYTILWSVFICIFLSSCSSLRKVDDRQYSSRNKSRSHRTVKKSNTKTSRSKTSTKSTNKAIVKSTRKKNNSNVVSKRDQIVSIAKTYQGTPYQYGGENPSGFDCSGFLQYIYEQAGITIPRTSNQQARVGKSKSWNQSIVGDIMIFGEPNRVSHVGLVCEVTDHSLKVIHSTSSRGVIITDIRHSDYWQQRLLYARDVLYN